MMDELNRVNPDEVLPRDLQKEKAELQALERATEKVLEVEYSREERRQQVLDQREIANRQAAAARLATKRGFTPQQRPVRSGRR